MTTPTLSWGMDIERLFCYHKKRPTGQIPIAHPTGSWALQYLTPSRCTGTLALVLARQLRGVDLNIPLHKSDNKQFQRARPAAHTGPFNQWSRVCTQIGAHEAMTLEERWNELIHPRDQCYGELNLHLFIFKSIPSPTSIAFQLPSDRARTRRKWAHSKIAMQNIADLNSCYA